MSLHYGVCSFQQVQDTTRLTCDALGYGTHGVAHLMLMEIAATETALGQKKRRRANHVGLYQQHVDEIALIIDNQTRRKHDTDCRDVVMAHFGHDIWAVTPDDIEHDILLASIFMRIQMRNIQEYIPMRFLMRAQYWYQYLNHSRFSSHRLYVHACQLHLPGGARD